jgi:hypothetical protein
MGSYAAHLNGQLDPMKERIKQLERELTLAESKLNSFFTGDIPENATFDHMILAKYGRIRLTEKAKTAALLLPNNQQI